MSLDFQSAVRGLFRPFAGSAVLRALFARPAYAIISVTVLGVSIAAQLIIVSIVDAMLVRPPSARSPGELVFIRSSLPSGVLSYPDFLDIKERSSFYSGIFAYNNFSQVGITHDDELAVVPCAAVSGGYFPTMGVSPMQGTLFSESDDSQSAEPTTVISASLAASWNLGLDSILKINSVPFRVVGILPADFQQIERYIRPQIWIPLSQTPRIAQAWLLRNRGFQWIKMGARLKPGVTTANANAELAVMADRLLKENPVINVGMKITADSFTGFRLSLDQPARTMVLISGVVALLLALAFTNFFALTLLRIFARRRELAVKLAMGATRAHLGRWLLGELGLVSALSILVGYGLSRAFFLATRFDPNLQKLIQNASVTVDLTALSVVVGLVFVGACVVWLLSLQNACRVDVLSALKESASAPRRQRMMSALYALQFAIALFLLSVATSFVGTLWQAANRPLPFRSENLLLADINLQALGLKDAPARVFVNKVLEAVRQVPGVVSAGASSAAPMTIRGSTNLIVNDRDPALEPDKAFCLYPDITPGLLETAGISLLQGRTLTEQDIASGTFVSVINAAAARRFWPGEMAVGKNFKPWPESAPYTVIGVAEDMPTSISAKIDPLVYLPYTKVSKRGMVLHIAVQRDTAGMRQEIARCLQTLWPYKNIPPLRSIQDQIALASTDLATTVKITLWVAGFATLVTGFGLYFFSAYTASQTVRDAAIRMAIGARPADIVWAHLRRYRIAILCGFGLGALLLSGARPLFSRLDIPVAAPEFATFLLATVPLLVIAIAGLCVPLRKVGRLDVSRTLNGSD